MSVVNGVIHKTMDSPVDKLYCEKCHKPLQMSEVVWLTYDQRTGYYTDQEVPDEFAQGAFPFGKICAKKMQKDAK